MITILRNKRGIGALGSGNLTYHGGVVQKDPQVFVLFWGSWWASGCADSQGNGTADENYLYALYNGLATTSDNQSPIDSQYYGPSGSYPIFPTLAGKAFITWNADCTDPPAAATQAQLAAEAVAYATNLAGAGYSITNNTQIVVVSPTGTNPGGGFGTSYCAYHSYAQYSTTQLLSWTNLPYIPDAGSSCGANIIQSADDGWSIVGGHEYNESVTDPFINAWYDSAGYEIGDKCAWTGIFVDKLSTGSFAMQPEWDNRTAACQQAATYKHGNIKLAANTSLCAADSSLTSGSGVTLYSPCDSKYARTWVQYPDHSLRRWRNTAMCVVPLKGSSANGTHLVLYRCNGNKIQKWTWTSSTGEWKNNSTGKCMTAATAANGAALTESTCVGGATQKFSSV